MSAPGVTVLRDALLAEFGRPVAGDDVAGREVAAVLALAAATPPAPVAFAGVSHPALRHLDSALDEAEVRASALVAALRPLAHGLPWRYGYAPRADAPGLEHRMAWAELIGPAAPFRNAQVGLGLTLIGPHTFYPPHRHPAVEVYRVIAGTAQWSADGQTRARPPGAVIVHASNQVHAMRTADQPLLALYSWSGDVDSPSVWEDRP